MAYLGDKKILSTIFVDQVKGIVYDYTESMTYEKGEIVYYNGNIYTPIVATVKGVLPTDTANWKPLSSGGGGGGGAVIVAVALTEEGGLDFTMSDGTHLYTASVKGEKGEKGEQGEKGEDGTIIEIVRLI